MHNDSTPETIMMYECMISILFIIFSLYIYIYIYIYFFLIRIVQKYNVQKHYRNVQILSMYLINN